MGLPKSLVQPFRQGQLTVGAGWRAYFAPFNRALATANTSTQLGPSIYDLEIFNKFIDATPTPGWFDLGYIKKFKFTPQSKIGAVRSGYRGAIRAQYRGEVGETLTFVFEEMSRLALSVATGTQAFNLLKTTQLAPAASGGPLSASGTSALAMSASGYSASGFGGATAGLPTLIVGTGSGASFPAGSYIVCDQDYVPGTYGFVGDAGANVFPGAVTDVDFIRKTSDYVATVKAVVTGIGGGDALVLTAPFVGGGNASGGVAPTGPTTGAKVQLVTGYASREGGTYIREWSGVFIMDTIDASQLLFYYPRISPNQFSGLDSYTLENAGTTDLGGYELNANFNALAYDDPLDGETVVRYSAYYPNPNQTIQS